MRMCIVEIYFLIYSVLHKSKAFFSWERSSWSTSLSHSVPAHRHQSTNPRPDSNHLASGRQATTAPVCKSVVRPSHDLNCSLSHFWQTPHPLGHPDGTVHHEENNPDNRGTFAYLPRDVGFPAAPGFRQMLQNCARLVLLDPLRHHVQDVMHHLCTSTHKKTYILCSKCISRMNLLGLFHALPHWDRSCGSSLQSYTLEMNWHRQAQQKF